MIRALFIALMAGSALLGLSFVLALGRPWRSEVPAAAWLQAMLAAVTVAFDVVIVLVMLAVAVPPWVVVAVVAVQDGVFAWRLRRLWMARQRDIRIKEPR